MLKVRKLEKDKIEYFRTNGFVVDRNSFEERDSCLIQSWASDLAALPEESGKHWVYSESSQLSDRKIINRIENIQPFHQGFSELARSLIAPVGQLFGEEATLFKDKINYKLPGGDGFKAHQDSQAGWEKYATYFITVMVCIDSATIENGCLQLASRPDHKLVGKEWEPLSESEKALIKLEPVPTDPGDVIFFDSYVPHSSDPNLTSTPRRLYFATFNKLSEGDNLASYFKDKWKSYPPDIDREEGRKYTYRV